MRHERIELKHIKNTIIYRLAGFLLSLPFVLGLVPVIYFGSTSTNVNMTVFMVIYCIFNLWLLKIALVPFGGLLYYVMQVNNGVAMICQNSGCSTRQGPLGAGKSSSAGYEIVIKAKQMWERLQVDYKVMKLKAPDWYRNKDEDNIKKWTQTRKAYKFYKNHPDRVPCLFSYIPLKVDGMYAHKLTVKHLTQKKALPGYTCAFIDELEFMIDQDMYLENSENREKLKEIFRFYRHFFGNGTRLIGTEQNSDSVNKDIRKVMVTNDYMLSQTWKGKPNLLRRILFFLEDIIVAKDQLTRKQVELYDRFARFVKSIGFRKYEYVITGNADKNFLGNSKALLFTPAYLNCEMEDRAFMALYNCLDDKLRANTFRSMLKDPNDERLLFVSTKQQEMNDKAKAERKRIYEERRKSKTFVTTNEETSPDYDVDVA